MRIALVTLFPLEKDIIPGGVRMVSHNLVQSLRNYPDVDIHVVHCHSDIQQDRLERDGPVTLHYLALPKRRIVPNLITSVGRIQGALRAIQPDLVHAHTGRCAYASLKAGYPTVYTIHGVLPAERRIYARTLFDRLRYALHVYYEGYALRHAQQVVAISRHVLEAYRQYETAHWIRIDNPVPRTFFELPDLSEPGRILYAGSIDERKDVLTLVRVIERLSARFPALRLIVAGKVNNLAYDRQVRGYVAEHGLQDVVRFVGLLSLNALLDEYARCAVVALASREENAPMVVIEAMAAGKPVVATAVGGVPDIVQDGESGYLAPVGDEARLAERIGALLADDALRARMGRRARELAAERFQADAVARQYYDLYRKVLAGT